MKGHLPRIKTTLWQRKIGDAQLIGESCEQNSAKQKKKKKNLEDIQSEVWSRLLGSDPYEAKVCSAC